MQDADRKLWNPIQKKRTEINQKKNEEAISLLYKTNYQKWYDYAVSRGMSSEDSQDIIHTFILKLLQTNRLPAADNELEAYAMRSLQNTIKTWQKRHKRLWFSLEEDIQIDESIDIEEIVLEHIEYKNLVKVVKRLPEIYQKIIYLQYYENMSTFQIAERMEMKENVVRSYRSCAGELLREAHHLTPSYACRFIFWKTAGIIKLNFINIGVSTV